MGHWCRICGQQKPNEKFSGKGHKNHICKLCSKKATEEIENIDHTEEIIGFLSQSNISSKNMRRLSALIESEDKEVAHLASIVFEVAMVKPGKKRRLKVLARERRDLLEQMEQTGLIYAHHH